MDPIITLSDVGKRYVKYQDTPLLLTRALRFSSGRRRSHMWALRNIDLRVEPGETVGVIGRNGSGKSTMFRILAGVTAPTEGAVRVGGRVAPLISVGVGFHPELTGRENVYVNGAILGLTSREIDRRLDSIVAFAEIGDFLDTPVKFYSTGMFVRLGFSVAVASQPEILLVDEVLSVGDAFFQRRCFERMEQIRREGATVLLVSHNMNAIRSICSRTLVLNDGVELFTGDTDEAISLYHQALEEGMDEATSGAADAVVERFVLSDGEGMSTANVKAGDEVTFMVEARFNEPAEQPAIGFWIYSKDGLVYGDHLERGLPARIEAGGVIRCDIRLRASLASGSYTAKVLVATRFDRDAAMARPRPLNFFVSGRRGVIGAADLGAVFEVRMADDVTSHAPMPPVLPEGPLD